MKNRNFVVGIFVLAALGLFTVGLFMIGNRHDTFSRHVEYFVEFTDLSGLTKGSKVKVAGMDAGEIVAIAVPASPRSRFRLQIRVNHDLRGLIRNDSMATIGTEGVVGNTFLLIRSGSSQAAAATPGSTLASTEPTELADLLNQSKGLLTDVDSAVKKTNGLITSAGGNVNETLTTIRSTVANANDVVLALKAGRGPAGMLLQDPELAARIRGTLSNTEQTTQHLNHASSQADALISNLQARQLPQKLDDTLGSIRGAAANLDVTSTQLRHTVDEATGPDARNVTAGANIRESLSNLTAATDNIADETEALKHNFFFRGFFIRRGYYHLDPLSADSYGRDRLFTNPTNEREWLSGVHLFETDGSGAEGLTVQGKRRIDEAIMHFGNAILSTPLVVEGYSDNDDAAEQLVQSENRALLVRVYLETHFHVSPGNIGAVAMKSTPPSFSERTSWDGICIVALNSSHK